MYLFHGSNIPSIKILEPKYSNLVKDNVVFAGELWAAIAYTGKWNDSTIQQGTINGIPYLKEMIPNAFADTFSNGGYLYVIPSKYFISLPCLTKFEKVSYKAVPILREIFIKEPLTILESMIRLEYYNNKGEL